MAESNWDVGLSIIQENVRTWVYGPTISGEDLTQLRSGLTYAERALTSAEAVAEFRRADGAVRRLRQGREAIALISSVLDGIQVFRDIDQVRGAIRDLRRIGNVGRDPAGAANAFGRLFSGLGGLAGHLPAPANAYADFLSESGEFFTNMLTQLDPARRWEHREDGRAVDLSRPMSF
jgi:hypothetical protein